MSAGLRLWGGRALAVVLLTFVSACVVPGGAYEPSVGVAYGVGYYEPSGHEYGGWAPGYQVGPPRGGYSHPERSHYEASPPAYRPASPSRPMPSIPTRSRQGAQHDRH